MGTLSAKQRDNLKSSQFALSGDRYPINDVAHAENAKARAAQQYNAGNLSKPEEDKVISAANHFLETHHHPVPKG